MLASVEEDAVAEFLRLEFEYRAQAARHNVEPDDLRSLIDPAFHPVIEDLAEHYSIEIIALSTLDISIDMTINVEEDMHTLAGYMAQWNTAARKTLQQLVGVATDEPTVDEAKEQLTAKVKWNARLKTFKSTLHTYMAHYRQTVQQYRLKSVIDHNGKEIVRHLISTLYPEAFKRKVAAENLKRGKLNTVADLFNLLDEFEPHFEGAMDQLRLQRKSTRQPTKYPGSKTNWDTRTPKTAHSNSTTRTVDTSRAAQTTHTSQHARTQASHNPHAVRTSMERQGSTSYSPKQPYVPQPNEKQATATATKAATSRGPIDEPRPLYACKYCGAMHWHKDCDKNPHKDSTRSRPARPEDTRRHLHGKAAALSNEDIDGRITIDDLILPFTIDTGASHNFVSYACAHSLLHAKHFSAEELLPPIKVRIASRDSTHYATHKLRTNATVTLDTGEERTMSNLVLYLVTDFGDEVLLGRPALNRLGIDIKAQLRHVFATPKLPEGTQTNGDSSDSEPTSPRAFFANLTNLDAPDEADLAMDEQLAFLDVGDAQMDAIVEAIRTGIKNAGEEGLSDASCARLHEEIINTDLCNAFRITMAADPPADVPPVKITFNPSIYDVTHGPRRYSPIKAEFMDAHLNTLAAYGYVKHNPCAAIASPAHPVRKAAAKPDEPPESQFRLTVDLRAVNNATQPMHYPLPLLDTITRVVAGATHFATIDLNNGYWQIPLHPDSQEFFSIRTDKAVYTPTRLIQGSRNAAGIFQAAMTDVLHNLVHSICIVYIDDILIYARSETDLISNILTIIRRLHDRQFKISAKKITFFRKQTKFCGRIFSADGVSFDTTYINAITQMSKPSNAAELRTYLASANWIRSSIPSFSRLAAPLQELLTTTLQLATTKYQSTKTAFAKHIILSDHGWDDSHNTAFQQLTTAIAASVTLAYPDPDWDLCLYADASDLHWGAAITQRRPEDALKPIHEQDHRPIAFLSGTFTTAQSRWPTIEQEAYAIVQTCIKTSHILQRPQGFTIYTDHRNNTFLFSLDAAVQDGHKQAAERIERWQVLMRAFNYTIRHVSGDDNFLADMLSRWAAPSKDLTHPQLTAKVARRRHKQTTTAPVDATFAPHVAVQFNVADAPQEEEIINVQNSVTARMITDMDLRKDADDVIVTTKGQIYVHNKRHLRLRLCIVAHQGPAGHRGIDVTTRWLTERFWWPSILRDISVFCRTCLQCQYTRGGKTVPRPHLNTFFPTRPNQQLHFDFFYVRDATSSAPETPTYVLVILDAYSRFVWLHAATNADAVTTVNAILQWFALFGKAQRFVSDQGSHFHNELLTLLEQRCLVQHHFTVAHAPWSNGRVERVNRELRELLSALITESRLDADCWPELLPVINFIINNTPTATLAGHSPAQVFIGHAPNSPLDIIFKPSMREFATVNPTSAEIIAQVSKLQQELHNTHQTLDAVHPRSP
jgi:transposase InsO family protein